MDVGPMKHFTLDPQVMKTWGPGLWAIFVALVVLVGALLHNLYKELVLCGCIYRYIIALAATVAIIYLNTKRVSKQGRELHVHHYMLGFILACTFGY